ncbi:hypothetical protein CR513_22755, partial [Mucuna pruriens]
MVSLAKKRQKHSTLGLPMIDYDKALSFQPMLMSGRLEFLPSLRCSCKNLFSDSRVELYTFYIGYY